MNVFFDKSNNLPCLLVPLDLCVWPCYEGTWQNMHNLRVIQNTCMLLSNIINIVNNLISDKNQECWVVQKIPLYKNIFVALHACEGWYSCIFFITGKKNCIGTKLRKKSRGKAWALAELQPLALNWIYETDIGMFSLWSSFLTIKPSFLRKAKLIQK